MFIPITSAKWILKFGHQLNDKTAFCYCSMYRWDDRSLSIRIGGMNDLAVPLFPRFFNFGMMAITLIDKKLQTAKGGLSPVLLSTGAG
jgi:hypothetical protein